MPLIYTRQVRTRGLRPDWSYLVREVSAELDNRVKPDLLGYFDRIVANWKDEHKPAFRARKTVQKDYVKVWVYPAGPNKLLWRWLSITGTKEHDITPRDKKSLKFIWGGPGSYHARTTTSGGHRGPGGATGDWVRYAKVVHPGFKPRGFEKHIARWYRPKFLRYVENAFRRGIYKAKAHGKSA